MHFVKPLLNAIVSKLTLSFFFLLPLSIAGCRTLSQPNDPLQCPESLKDFTQVPAQNNTPYQWKKSQIPRPPKQASEPPLPPALKQRVTIVIGDHLPLKSALLSISQQTGVDLQLEGNLEAKLFYSAHNRPFIDVIREICDLAYLRYTLKGNSVQIKRDTPYPLTYHVQFLNQNRTSNNSTSIATNIFATGNESNGNGGLGNGSSSNVSAETKNDFWEELKQNLEIILTDHPPLEDVPVQPKENKKNPPPTHPVANNLSNNRNSFTLHRQAGIITVRATSRHHALIKDYLNQVKQATQTQVLIEAKVIEVSLKEEFKAGINWQNLAKNGIQAKLPFGKFAQEGKLTDPMNHHGDFLTLGFRDSSFSAILQAIQQFGSCKTLSSPRVTVLNNQNAILKVAQNQVYFRLRYDRQYNLNINREDLIVASDIQTVPIGLVMSVQPSIDRSSGKIILSLRPTISRLNRSVADPAVELAYATSGRSGEPPRPSLVPVVDVREIDTLIETEPGKIVVLGGLMESRKAYEENKLPGLGDVPLLGKLVTGQSQSEEVIELVVLLKASFVDSEATEGPNPADERLVEQMDDPRPF